MNWAGDGTKRRDASGQWIDPKLDMPIKLIGDLDLPAAGSIALMGSVNWI